MRQLVNRFRRLHPIRVKLLLGRLGRLPQHTEIIVYRLVQECCNNIAKHSGASNVNISVSSADGWVSLAVEDNGVGFRVEEALARKRFVRAFWHEGARCPTRWQVLRFVVIPRMGPGTEPSTGPVSELGWGRVSVRDRLSVAERDGALRFQSVFR